MKNNNLASISGSILEDLKPVKGSWDLLGCISIQHTATMRGSLTFSESECF